MSWLIRLYQIPVVKATLERMWRGGIVAVASAYVGGQLVLSDMSFHSGTTLVGRVLVIFVTGAFASLLLALGISKVTGTGPAINKGEQIKPRLARPYHDPDKTPLT